VLLQVQKQWPDIGLAESGDIYIKHKKMNRSRLRALIGEAVREVLAEKKIEPNKKKKTKSTTEKESEKVTKTAEKEATTYKKKKYGSKFDSMLPKPTMKLKEALAYKKQTKY